ncbi:uncharacterized protein LOC110807212 isoform X2 [Carica papaya]|uniref:uncharacterized protein LOC110807212 isoform X2 n=1 Tax=Carica papaya TaxID=3649 RepID=UPI000B8C910B|nr:uncharacterized protein LOC110807212 isoform X2 [Carica papaya]
MAVSSGSESKNKLESGKVRKRAESAGVRVVGGRIYDPQNGKTCHQCRQKTIDFSASCKNQKQDKQCPIKFCHKCLLNRYGEKAEDVALLDDWKCPKCRGICNCSFCMKKRGHRPTGVLAHRAKATGFSSVLEMLQVKGPENIDQDKLAREIGASPKKLIPTKKESVATSPRKAGKENSFDEQSNSSLKMRNVTSISNEKKSLKSQREGLKEIPNSKGDDDADLEKPSPKRVKVSKETPRKDGKKKEKRRGDFAEKKNNSLSGGGVNDVEIPGEVIKEEKSNLVKEVSDGKAKKKGDNADGSRKDVKKKESIGDFAEEKNSWSRDVVNGVKISGEISKEEKRKLVREVSNGMTNMKGDNADGSRNKRKKKEKGRGDFAEKENDSSSKTFANDVKVSEEISREEKPKFVKESDSKTRVLKNNSLNSFKAEDKDGIKFSKKEGLNGVKNDNLEAKLKGVPKLKKHAVELKNKEFDTDIQLPQGATSVTIGGVDVPPEDVGDALQFLEFCAAFGEVLGMRKGQAESVIRELIRGRSTHRLQYSSNVQIHIQLLSLIQKDKGEKFPSLTPTAGKRSWLQALGQCISESEFQFKYFSTNCFNKVVDGYEKLDASKKLKLLNFLCDEVLCTTALRNWIDDQNSKFGKKEKEAKAKVTAARDKEKQLKQKLLDEVAKAIIAKNGAPLTIPEHEAIVSQIKRETTEAHAEMLEAMGLVPKKRQRSDAVRTEAILLDTSGHAFWRLKGYDGQWNILLQDVGTCDALSQNEKWFAYDAEQKQEIEKYISCVRKKMLQVQQVIDTPPVSCAEASS